MRISTTAPEVAEHIGAILGQFEVEAFVGGTAIVIDLIDSPEPYRLSIDDQDRMHLATAAEAIGAAFRYILGAIHGEADFLALIHGASVVAPSGKALLLPGASGSGKSTLAAYLSRCGFAFLSDDMIALRSPDGRALGWPMPHSIKEGSWHRLAPLMPELATATIYEVRGRKIKYVAATPKREGIQQPRSALSSFRDTVPMLPMPSCRSTLPKSSPCCSGIGYGSAIR
ncbi:hypothetical protein [Sphingopyxis macrogoltabida]|uniref:hypothetical protein n=1 Tax=Sphingopyxis macrogoltabida TaxID=33050 RepID=UPI001F33D699|nr:hypothetical protein [Sphingopyxis macrogoltabida]